MLVEILGTLPRVPNFSLWSSNVLAIHTQVFFFSLAMQLPAETSKRPKWWRYWGSTQKYRWSIGATKRCWDYTFSNLRNEMTLYTCIYIYKYIEICSISGYSKNRVLHTCPALQARKGLNVLASNPWKIQSIFSTLWGGRKLLGLMALLPFWRSGKSNYVTFQAEFWCRRFKETKTPEVKTQHAPARSIGLQMSQSFHHIQNVFCQILRKFPELGRLTW